MQTVCKPDWAAQLQGLCGLRQEITRRALALYFLQKFFAGTGMPFAPHSIYDKNSPIGHNWSHIYPRCKKSDNSILDGETEGAETSLSPEDKKRPPFSAGAKLPWFSLARAFLAAVGWGEPKAR